MPTKLATKARLQDRSISVTDAPFNARGDGETDDSGAVSDAMDALIEAGGGTLVFPPAGNFLLANPISKDVTQYKFTAVADGATITANFDGTAFDLNPNRTSWDGSDTNTKRSIRWFGGRALNTSGSQTASRFIKAWGMRGLQIRGVRAEGWWRAIEFAGKDTYLFDQNTFFGNEYDLYHPTDTETGITSAGDLPLMIKCFQNAHSGTPVSAIYLGTKVSGFASRDNSYNCIASGPTIYLRDSSLLFGEGYLFDGDHFEQMAAGQYAIQFDDANSQGFYGVSLRNLTIGSGTAGWKGVKFARCRGVKIDNNVIRDGSGGSTEVIGDFDANCRDIQIGGDNEYLSIATAGYWQFNASIPRSSISILPEYRSGPVVVTGYNTTGFSTGNATLDMSTVISSKWPTFGTPKGYILSLKASDSGSAASTTSRVAVQTSSGAINNNALYCAVMGAPNSTSRMVGGYVEADANGDIYIDYIASGSGTMTISLNVMAVIM